MGISASGIFIAAKTERRVTCQKRGRIFQRTALRQPANGDKGITLINKRDGFARNCFRFPGRALFRLGVTRQQTGKAFTAFSTEDRVAQRRVTELDVELTDLFNDEGLAVLQIDRIAGTEWELRRGVLLLVALRVENTLHRLVSLRLVEDHALDPVFRRFPGFKRIDRAAFAVENQVAAVAVDVIVTQVGSFKGFHNLFHALRGKLRRRGLFFLCFLCGNLLCIRHNLLDKGTVSSLFRGGKPFPNGNRVDVVKVVLLLLCIETVVMNELGDSLLHHLPCQLCGLRAPGTDSKVAVGVFTAIFAGKPRGGIFLLRMLPHIADNGVLAFNSAVPGADRIVNIVLRQRAEKLVEAGIALVKDLLVQPCAELRIVGKQLDQLHIAGIENIAAHGGVGFDSGKLRVRAHTGIPIYSVLHYGAQNRRLVPLQLLQSRGLCLHCLLIPERTEAVRSKLGFMGVLRTVSLMVKGQEGSGFALAGFLIYGRYCHIVFLAEQIEILRQHLCQLIFLQKRIDCEV